MGTDIHGVVQVKKNGKWETVQEILKDRNYRVFAVLGNVRNGYGFAGVETHSEIKPLSDCRGFPEDFDYDERESTTVVPWTRKWFCPGDEHVLSLGDHSFSWVSLKELRDYDWDAGSTEGGLVDEDTYKKWKAEGTTRPESWSDGVGGSAIAQFTEQEYLGGKADDVKRSPAGPFGMPTGTGDRKTVYIACAWNISIRGMVGKSFFEWVDALDQYLDAADGDPANIRLVFGFDS